MARGVRALEHHLAGKRLTLRQAVQAKCADCMCRYLDGPMDCRIPKCPLYPFSPYGSTPRKRASSSARRRVGGVFGPKPPSDVSGQGVDPENAPEGPKS